MKVTWLGNVCAVGLLEWSGVIGKCVLNVDRYVRFVLWGVG